MSTFDQTPTRVYTHGLAARVRPLSARHGRARRAIFFPDNAIVPRVRLRSRWRDSKTVDAPCPWIVNISDASKASGDTRERASLERAQLFTSRISFEMRRAAAKQRAGPFHRYPDDGSFEFDPRFSDKQADNSTQSARRGARTEQAWRPSFLHARRIAYNTTARVAPYSLIRARSPRFSHPRTRRKCNRPRVIGSVENVE